MATFIFHLSTFILIASCTSDSETLPSVQPDALAQLPAETQVGIAAQIAAMQAPATRADGITWYGINEIHPDKEVNFNLYMPGGSENTQLYNYDGNAFKDLPDIEPFASLMLKDFNLTEGDDRCVSRWTYLIADHSGLDYLYGFARLAAGADGKPVLDYGKMKRAHSKVTIRLVDSQGQAVPVVDGVPTLSATIRSANTAIAPIYLTDEAGNGTLFDSYCKAITTLAADKAIDPDNIALAAYEVSTGLKESPMAQMESADGQTNYYGEQNNELCAIVPPTATYTQVEGTNDHTPIATPSFTDEEKLTISVTSDPDGDDGPLTTGTYTLKLKDVQVESGEMTGESVPLSSFNSGTHYVITVTLDHNRLVTGTAQLADWNQTSADVTPGGDPSALPTVDAATTDTEVWKTAIKEAYEKNVPLILTGNTLATDEYDASYFCRASAGLENELPAGSIDLILPDVTELPEYAFNGCDVLRSVSAPKATTVGDAPFNQVPLTRLTFGSVIESMEYTLGNSNSENCTLTLAEGKKQFKLDANTVTLKPTDAVMTAAAPTASEADRTWANCTWKEIIITPSTNNE